MPKIYFLCIIATLIGAISIMPANQSDGFWYYIGCFLSAAVCYFVTAFQDEKEENRPSWKFRLSASVAASYLAFHLYPSFKDLIIEIPATKISFKPFPTIHIFIGLCSYFGITIFRELKTLSNFGIKKYIGKIGDQLKAISKDKK